MLGGTRATAARAWLGALVMLVAVASPAAAADRKARVDAAARTVIAPRYEAFAAAAERQAEAWRAGCADAAALKAAFKAAADAWSGIEFVRYGAVMEDNRIERIAHWPERQNAVQRALARLLAADDASLTPERLMESSIAGQGLSALERLLYEGPGAADAKRCAVGRAVAAGLARTAATVQDGWKTAPADSDDAATRLATELLSFTEFVADQKLGAPLGKGADGARPALAEGWRSGRSLDAIRANLEGLEALAAALVDPASDTGAGLLAALKTARSIAADTTGALGDLVSDPKGRRDVTLLRDAVRSVQELAGPALTESLDVTIGFNSRDGD